MSEKSSRVPEWYTSGSWANAFDNTGWQKSPEYALIRIAAGAPDLAKSGQIRPRTAPDGKSSRIWRQGSLLLPRLKSCPELFFPDTRTTRPSRQTDSEARRVLRQSPTHSANVRTLRKTLAENRRQGSGHSAHCAHRAQPKPTHVHKLCTPETQTCTLVHTAPQLPTQVAENTSSMCCSCWEEGGAERPRAIDVFIIIYFYIFFSIFFFFLFLFATRVTLNAKSNISGGTGWGDHTRIRNEELCGTRRNASDFARTFFHRRKKDAKRSQKGLPFSIYI